MKRTAVFKPLERCDCAYCKLYGDGTLWYLNPKNYSPEKAKKVGTTSKQKAGGHRTVDRRTPFKELGYKLESRLYGPKLREIIEKEQRRDDSSVSAFVPAFVPVEEAKEIVRIADKVFGGRGFLNKWCDCSVAVRGKYRQQGCLTWGDPYFDRWEKSRGIEELSGARLLPVEEAMDYVDRMDEKGYMTHVSGGYGGHLYLFCFCELSECEFLQYRVYYGLTAFRRKGHYVAFQDPEKCTGCGRCVAKCQFHAITRDITRNKAAFDMWKCFGCGVCRRACDQDAISLVPRADFPTLAEEW